MTPSLVLKFSTRLSITVRCDSDIVKTINICTEYEVVVWDPFSVSFGTNIRIFSQASNKRRKSKSCGLAVEYSAHDCKVVGSIPVQC